MSTVLLSINPKYSQSILHGRKAVEFRKVPFKEKVDRVVIYETAPTSAIVGAFDVEAIDAMSPSAAWYSRIVAGMPSRAFFDYYRGHHVAVCIKIGTVARYATPIPLPAIGIERPPQSFRYLRAAHLDKLTLAIAEQGDMK